MAKTTNQVLFKEEKLAPAHLLSPNQGQLKDFRWLFAALSTDLTRLVINFVQIATVDDFAPDVALPGFMEKPVRTLCATDRRRIHVLAVDESLAALLPEDGLYRPFWIDRGRQLVLVKGGHNIGNFPHWGFLFKTANFGSVNPIGLVEKGPAYAFAVIYKSTGGAAIDGAFLKHYTGYWNVCRANDPHQPVFLQAHGKVAAIMPLRIID